MSSPELVFLHIPKTAGTSQHHDFNNYIGAEHVFWIGMDCPAGVRSYPRSLAGDKLVVGGHKHLSFYPRSFDPLYCAILRDPVERAISLFVYYTRPELAVSAHDRDIRDAALQRMLARGIDPDSMYNSIRECRSFRREISNSQCKYLSRRWPTFNGVHKSLQDQDFLIGTVGHYELFHRELWGLLDWPDATAVRANRSTDNYAAAYMGDAELVSLIGELNKEDQKLVDWVETEHQGLWLNIQDGHQRRQRLRRLPRKPDQRKVRQLSWEDTPGLWRPRGRSRLQWPLSRMIVVPACRLAYMPTSGALDETIQRLMLELSPVEHKDIVHKFGIDRVAAEFATGLMLEDRTTLEIRAIAASGEYFKFAIVYEPLTRLVDIYQQHFVEMRDSLSHWPRLRELLADVQGCPEPDYELAITFRQFVQAIASGSYDLRFWLPQSSYLPWAESYDRLYRPDQLAALARDLLRLRGLAVSLDTAPAATVVTPAHTVACYADTLPAQLPADPAAWRNQLVDEALLEVIKDYYAADFTLYNRLADQDQEEAGV